MSPGPDLGESRGQLPRRQWVWAEQLAVALVPRMPHRLCAALVGPECQRLDAGPSEPAHSGCAANTGGIPVWLSPPGAWDAVGLRASIRQTGQESRGQHAGWTWVPDCHPVRAPGPGHSPVGRATGTPPPAARCGHPRGCPGPRPAGRGCAGPASSAPGPGHWLCSAAARRPCPRSGPFTSTLPGRGGGPRLCSPSDPQPGVDPREASTYATCGEPLGPTPSLDNALCCAHLA